VSENLPLRCLFLRYYEHLFLFSILKLHVTSSRFCLYLLNIYHFTCTFSHAHTEAHKHTCTISIQEEWRQPSTGAWLRGAEERICQRPCKHTTKKNRKKNVRKNPIFTNLKKRFEHIELPAKLLEYFLRSIKATSINRKLSHVPRFLTKIAKAKQIRKTNQTGILY